PSAAPVTGPCDSYLPGHQSYGARVQGVTCGEGAEQTIRLPEPVDKEIMDQWDLISRTGKAFAQEEMQQIRQIDLAWQGDIQFPLYENWSYEQKVGDFSAARCGTQAWHTT